MRERANVLENKETLTDPNSTLSGTQQIDLLFPKYLKTQKILR